MLSKTPLWDASLEKVLFDDLTVPRRPADLSATTKAAIEEGDLRRVSLPLIYTVFDGDQQQLSSVMKRTIMAHGKCPVNPPSILGYRDTVVRRGTKQGVLSDDLALLKRSHEVWIFSSLPCDVGFLDGLAEGMIAELVCARSEGLKLPVRWVDLSETLRGASTPRLVTDLVDQELARRSNIQREVGEFVSGVEKSSSLIRYFAYDPLDFKYAEWLRCAPSEATSVPLAPSLAVEIVDSLGLPEGSAGLVRCWISLLQLADELVVINPLNSETESSSIQRLSARVWGNGYEKGVTFRDWRDFEVPKAVLKEHWPITGKEREEARQMKRRLEFY